MKKALLNSLISGLLATSMITTAQVYAANEHENLSAKIHQLIIKLKGVRNPTNLEFTQTAKSATLSAIPGQNHVYKLTLSGVGSYLSYFSDRPKRITGIIPTDHFMKDWSEGNNNFTKNPPNAELESLALQSTKQVNYIFELSKPVYDAKQKTLTYTAKLLNSQAIAVKNIDLGYTVLFIDGLTEWHGNNTL